MRTKNFKHILILFKIFHLDDILHNIISKLVLREVKALLNNSFSESQSLRVRTVIQTFLHYHSAMLVRCNFLAMCLKCIHNEVKLFWREASKTDINYMVSMLVRGKPDNILI
jgi:hypothetical protein